MVINEDFFERIWYPSEHVVTRKISGETILVPISGKLANMQRIFSVNEVGAAAWELMDGKKRVRDIKQLLLEEFDVGEKQLEDDMVEFINSLKNADLVSEVDG